MTFEKCAQNRQNSWIVYNNSDIAIPALFTWVLLKSSKKRSFCGYTRVIWLTDNCAVICSYEEDQSGVEWVYDGHKWLFCVLFNLCWDCDCDWYWQGAPFYDVLGLWLWLVLCVIVCRVTRTRRTVTIPVTLMWRGVRWPMTWRLLSATQLRQWEVKVLRRRTIFRFNLLVTWRHRVPLHLAVTLLYRHSNTISDP